jgi:hypothetical protein
VGCTRPSSEWRGSTMTVVPFYPPDAMPEGQPYGQKKDSAAPKNRAETEFREAGSRRSSSTTRGLIEALNRDLLIVSM